MLFASGAVGGLACKLVSGIKRCQLGRLTFTFDIKKSLKCSLIHGTLFREKVGSTSTLR